MQGFTLQVPNDSSDRIISLPESHLFPAKELIRYLIASDDRHKRISDPSVSCRVEPVAGEQYSVIATGASHVVEFHNASFAVTTTYCGRKHTSLKMWDLLVIHDGSLYTPEDLHSYREARIAPGVSAQSR